VKCPTIQEDAWPELKRFISTENPENVKHSFMEDALAMQTGFQRSKNARQLVDKINPYIDIPRA